MKNIILWILVAMSLLATSCMHTGVGEHEDLQKARGAMRNLSKAMEACFKYENPPVTLQGRELLNFCTRHNPRLRDFYDNFTLRFKYDQGSAVVLVCSKDGGRWLMEDVSCTGEMDSPPIDNESERPCEFRLTAGRICQ